MEFTCIMCPVGCTLNVTKNGEEIIKFKLQQEVFEYDMMRIKVK